MTTVELLQEAWDLLVLVESMLKRMECWWRYHTTKPYVTSQLAALTSARRLVKDVLVEESEKTSSAPCRVGFIKSALDMLDGVEYFLHQVKDNWWIYPPPSCVETEAVNLHMTKLLLKKVLEQEVAYIKILWALQKSHKEQLRKEEEFHHLNLKWMKIQFKFRCMEHPDWLPNPSTPKKKKNTVLGFLTKCWRKSISNNMTLYCKKRCIYQASEAISWPETYYMPTDEDIASDSPKEENVAENDTVPTKQFQTEQGAATIRKNSTPLPITTVDKSRTVTGEVTKSGMTGCQTTKPKGEGRKIYGSFSDLSMGTGLDEHVETKWQEIRRMNKKDRRLSESSSESVMTSCGKKQEATGKSRKKKKKKRRSEQSCSIETSISQEETTDDPDPSVSLQMLSVSESPKRVTRSSITEAPPLPRGKTYHVFFSFRNSQNDKDWVRGIIKELESPPHCYSCCFADRDFIPGETVVNNIEMAVKESVRVAVVLTEEYIESYWCKYEATVIREPGSKACIIPLQLNNCRIPQSLKDLSFIPVSEDNDKWWETLLRALKGKIPHLPPTKSDHIFLFHGNSEKDMERIDNLRTALEMCACNFRCISSGRDFVCGSTVKDNVYKCVEKAATTVFALSSTFPKEKWLQHWQELRRKGFKLFPLMFDQFNMPKELQDIVIFDATREQNIWLPRLIDNLMN